MSTDRPKNLAGWDIDRLLLHPGEALEALEAYERGRMQSNKRIRDLLEANNRYLDDARAGRAREAVLNRELAVLRAGLKAVH